jgi:sporulation protein YlmC with PRC-barrel domain
MNRMTTMTLTTITLTMIAGTAFPVSATLAADPKDSNRSKQTDRMKHSDDKHRGTMQTKNKDRSADAARMGFHKSSDLLGAEIRNANGETIGSVEDMIIDRGTGAIEYIVLSNGGFLGIADKQVAVQYGSFGFDHAESRFRLDVTQEMIDQSSEFKPERWVELEYETWDEQIGEMYNEARESVADVFDDSPRNEAYSPEGAEEIEIEGTITKVNRDSEVRGNEHISVMVEGDDGARHLVVLGPSWYVMGDNAAPMRGDEVSITGYRPARSGNDRVIAREATIDGESITLRSDDGTTEWSRSTSNKDSYAESDERKNKDMKHREKDGRQHNVHAKAAPMMLLTDLVGMDANARDEDGGEISEAIIEVASGRVAMLAFDPNDAFLGIGDTHRVVPWSIVAVGSDAVTLDADANMLTRGEALPDNVSVYSNSARLSPVYRAFGVDVAEFEPREREDWTYRQTYRGWSNGDKLADAVEKGNDVSINGTVRGMTNATPVSDATAGTAVRVQTARGTETVVLGPEAYIESQNLDLGYGDEVTIRAKRAKIDGREVLVGYELTANGRTITLWNNDNPAWDEG